MIQFAHTWDCVWAKWMMSDEHDADDDFTQLNFDCIVEAHAPYKMTSSSFSFRASTRKA